MDIQLDYMDHIAICTRDMQRSLKTFKDLLGASAGPIEKIDEENVYRCFITLINTKIELISPISESSSLNKFLIKNGPGLHHICFKVNDIKKIAEHFKEKGYSPITNKPKKLIDGSKILFLHPTSTESVLIELKQF